MNDTPHAPPAARQGDTVELLHGHEVVDPYRSLEDGTDPETIAWAEAQDAYTRGLLNQVPGRDRIEARLRELLSVGSISSPAVRGRHCFYLRREGEQNQPVLYWREEQNGEERVLLDPNQLDPEGTTALDWWYPSRDGCLLAYGLSYGGDERSVLHVRDVASGADLADVIPQTRAASVAWLPDGSGFYYTRYPAPGEVPDNEANYHRRIFFHRLGVDLSEDRLIFGQGRDPEDWPSVQLSSDGRYLLVTVSRGWGRTDVYLRDENAGPGPFVPLIEGEAVLSSGQVAGGRLYLHTNLDAPRYRLFLIDPAQPDRSSWRQLVPEREDAVLEDAAVIAGRLFLAYLQDASSRLEVRDLDGGSPIELRLPALGTVDALTGEWDGKEAFWGFQSYTMPPSVYRYEPESGATTEWARVVAPLNSEEYDLRRVLYPSRDGTQISMFVVHRKGLLLDGNNPTLLTGYGGFNISLTPGFSRSTFFWLERGGVYAVANLRGGGEYGEGWHQTGMLSKKQNVFDDFIAAAEHLISSGYTRPERLAILGGSNGGLLVGAALTQRPDLFRAVICAVPLLDMLRYDQFQIARLWIPEYGSPDDAEQFEWLAAYSPYHHVRDSVVYPAVLLLTGSNDSRVDPMHARKMAARLQAANGGSNPVLLRVESEAGHGAGRPLSKTLAEQTDEWSFLCWQLGVPLS